MATSSEPRSDAGGRDSIGSLAESAVLGRIVSRLPAVPGAEVGPGDDAAVVASPDGRFVVTTDLMVHGPDFRLAWSRPDDLGWKAAATNLSDVAAMGARPTALVVALAAPAGTDVAVLEGIADGLREACAALAPSCGVVGGDLSVSRTLTIAVTAFGDLAARAPVLRSGARPGDVIAHAGRRGDAARGLALLFAKAVDDEGEPDRARAEAVRAAHADLVEAQLRPHPPVAAGVAAAIAGASAMLDVSDGLARDAARIASASAVNLDFDSAALGAADGPVVYGAEDHGLLATFPAGAAIPDGFDVIGRVAHGDGVSVDGRPIEPVGWDPYEDWDGGTG
ncbi:thiamine-monophosphate kinase [Agromyces rhizosphaerae]|uniref:Thiamine-monophosphate kinase n=1 Tax=Agromyces rhizosphaerae TaxID=88374 RepID=A0A9W6CYG7_9MICO|nr:thiamine-phosphate kinase [Agromyces rhizosphaerae]GLI28630.1 thiamine-monophosphate kinase [Agromyces rhizosphaerae]